MTDRDSLRREKARLRKIGTIILLLGFSSAGLVYWIGTRAEDSRLDEYNRAAQSSESRQVGILYGKSGQVTADLLDDLKRPSAEALIIAAITIVMAGGCFYLSRPLDEPAKQTEN